MRVEVRVLRGDGAKVPRAIAVQVEEAVGGAVAAVAGGVAVALRRGDGLPVAAAVVRDLGDNQRAVAIAQRRASAVPAWRMGARDV